MKIVEMAFQRNIKQMISLIILARKSMVMKVILQDKKRRLKALIAAVMKMVFQEKKMS